MTRTALARKGGLIRRKIHGNAHVDKAYRDAAQQIPRPQAHQSGAAMKILQAIVAVLLGVAAAQVAHSQAWPAKPLRMVVPFAPGGAVDVTGRIIAQSLSTRLGQQVVVENRGGAGGNIGVEIVAKSPADGYTIVMATAGQISINPHMYAKLAFDPVKDLAPISQAGTAINALCVHPSLPVKSVHEFIAFAKARPGTLNFASGGIGASDHMATELFMSMTGIRLVHVPYKGGGPAMVDLLGGNVDLGFSTVATAIGPVKAGRLRALGVTSAQRFELLPDVPTIAEAGVPGYESVAWYGLFAPTGTPAEIVRRLNAETVAILQVQDVRRRLTEAGVLPTSSSPETFTAYVATETARWGKLIRTNGIKAE
jgi:tripartite-type tricarboxylate transporter receptor subunit TctC